jgi:hypothetical protein
LQRTKKKKRKVQAPCGDSLRAIKTRKDKGHGWHGQVSAAKTPLVTNFPFFFFSFQRLDDSQWASSPGINAWHLRNIMQSLKLIVFIAMSS